MSQHEKARERGCQMTERVKLTGKERRLEQLGEAAGKAVAADLASLRMPALVYRATRQALKDPQHD